MLKCDHCDGVLFTEDILPLKQHWKYCGRDVLRLDKALNIARKALEDIESKFTGEELTYRGRVLKLTARKALQDISRNLGEE